MANISFFELTFQQHDENAPPAGELHRIMAGDKVFYAYGRQFVNPDLLTSLKKDEQVYIGAHLLNDGSYWLHWLFSQEQGALEPKDALISRSKALCKLIISIMIMVFSAYYCFLWINIWLSSILALTFIFGGFLFCFAIHKLVARMNSSMCSLLGEFERVKRGDFSFFAADQPLLSTDVGQSNRKRKKKKSNVSLTTEELAELAEINLLTVEGNAMALMANRYSSGSGQFHRTFVHFSFLCDNKLFNWHARNNEFMESLHPIFYRWHPLFLAEKDPVKLIMNQDSNQLVGLYNRQDNSAYLKVGEFVISNKQLKEMYISMIFGCGLMWFMSIFFFLHHWWQDNITPDKWDWLDFADFLYMQGLMYVCFICGMFLLFELGSLFALKFTNHGSKLSLTRRILSSFKIKNNQLAIIQDHV